MQRDQSRLYRMSVLRIVALGCLVLPGCGEKESPPEVISLEGKVEKIERTTDTTGRLTVVYYSERHQQEVSGTGQVTPETEIMIDGAAATLKDLREGEHVRGEVRVEKKGGKKVQTVIKIQAERSRPGGTSGR